MKEAEKRLLEQLEVIDEPPDEIIEEHQLSDDFYSSNMSSSSESIKLRR